LQVHLGLTTAAVFGQAVVAEVQEPLEQQGTLVQVAQAGLVYQIQLVVQPYFMQAGVGVVDGMLLLAQAAMAEEALVQLVLAHLQAGLLVAQIQEAVADQGSDLVMVTAQQEVQA
jgi:hypothetical protein